METLKRNIIGFLLGELAGLLLMLIFIGGTCLVIPLSEMNLTVKQFFFDSALLGFFMYAMSNEYP